MKAFLLFLVAAAVASQVLGEGVTVTTVGRGGARLGLLSGKKFPCSQPDPAKPTFGWADSGVLLPQETVPGSTGGATGNLCVDVCGLGYRLAAISNPLPTPPDRPSGPPPAPDANTPYLCRVRYTSQNTTKAVTRFLYGYYLSPVSEPSFSNPPGSNIAAGTGVCRVYSPEDKAVIEVTPSVGTPGLFDCGCCGTINRDGQRWERGCPDVIGTATSTMQCPANKPTDDICITTVTGNPDITMVFGTVSPAGAVSPTGRCFAAPPADPAGPLVVPGRTAYTRFCYKINPYNGPPAPDCKNKISMG